MSIFNEIFTTDGRINRLRYLKYMIVLALISGVSTFVLSSMATFFTGDPNSLPITMITGAWALIAGAGNIMLIIRRLHDMDKSGWFALLTFVPIVNVIFSIAMFFVPGTVGYNRYGADPLIE